MYDYILAGTRLTLWRNYSTSTAMH